MIEDIELIDSMFWFAYEKKKKKNWLIKLICWYFFDKWNWVLKIKEILQLVSFRHVIVRIFNGINF